VNARRIASLLALSLFAAGFCSPQYRALAQLPDHITLPRGDALRLSGLGAFGHRAEGGVRFVGGQGGLQLQARGSGSAVLTFGPVPVKRVAVRATAPRRVLLGGEAIAVTVRGRSTVAALDRVPTTEGPLRFPAGEAGLRVGDVLLSIDGHDVRTDGALHELVQSAGQKGRPVRVTVLREDGRHTLRLQPAFDRRLGRYRIGVYVRDQLSGVGTLSFADPERRTFAALGHPVALAAGARLSGRGEIAPAVVFGVLKAKRGRPGQKLGALDASLSPVGRITRNADVGIGGRLAHLPQGRLVAIATPAEVHAGPAELYTVLRGHKVEAFAVRVERVVLDRRAGSKGMVVRIVDRRLIELSGGIVQGMSGSPIVQDGRLVGAVTHVFVHDPTRGYATFASWMDRTLCFDGGSVRQGPREASGAPAAFRAIGPSGVVA